MLIKLIPATLVFLSGCKSDKADGPGTQTASSTDPSIPPPSADTVLQPSCAANSTIPAVLACTWTSDDSATGFVEFWLEGISAEVRTTPHGPQGTQHDVAVLGMKAGRTYEYRVVQTVGTSRIEGPLTTHVVPNVPANFPQPELVSVDVARSEVAGGYVLIAIAMMGAPPFTVVAILDGDGDYVWWTSSDTDGLTIGPRFSRDGRSIRYLQSDMSWLEDIGTIVRVSLDGDEIEETRALLGHHQMWENADGSLSWLGFDYATVDTVEWASDAIRTAPEGIDDTYVPTEEFAWFDAYAVDPWEAKPGADLVHLGEGIEWTHSNSLMALDDASFYVMAKNLDCLLKVDRATGGITWQIGGMYGDFTYADGAPVWTSLSNALFSQSHMSHIWDGGMVVFDNGDFSNPKVSRAVEFAWDEANFTIEEVWHYDEPSGEHTGSMGDVRKLAGGNYLVAWSSLGYLSEVTSEGEIVWKLETNNVGILGRVTPLTDLYAPPSGALP